MNGYKAIGEIKNPIKFEEDSFNNAKRGICILAPNRSMMIIINNKIKDIIFIGYTFYMHPIKFN